MNTVTPRAGCTTLTSATHTNTTHPETKGIPRQKEKDCMGTHDEHECDTHEHHGDEPGHVHDPHECDTHEHHGHLAA